MANIEDSRYLRTEKAIRAAYFDMAELGYTDKISVTNLCRAAGISRNAFYLHYQSVSALHESLVDEAVSDIRARCMASSTKVMESGSIDTELTAEIMDTLSCHERLFRAILLIDGGNLASRLSDEIADIYLCAAMVFGEHGESAEHKLTCAFAAWGLIGLVRRWLSDTDLPLKDALPYYDAVQSVISSKATDFLLQREQ